MLYMRIMFASYCPLIGELVEFGLAFLSGKGDERYLTIATQTV